MNEKSERNEIIKATRLTEDFWRNVPIVDATEMICLFPKKADLENATPGDPENCVYAKCIKRVWPEARRVRIWRWVALVETKAHNGETIAKRYIISATGKKALAEFDQGVGQIKPCTLLPPTTSTRLDGKNAHFARLSPEKKEVRKQRDAQRRKATLAGTYKPRLSKSPVDFHIRNGSGHSRAAVI